MDLYPTEPYCPYWPADLCYERFVLPVVREGVFVGCWTRGLSEVAALQHPFLPLWILVHNTVRRTWILLVRELAESVEIYRISDRSCCGGRISSWLSGGRALYQPHLLNEARNLVRVLHRAAEQHTNALWDQLVHQEVGRHTVEYTRP